MSQAGGFASDALEQIVDEAVHDAHGLTGDTSVRVDLLHDFVHIDAVAFSPLSSSFLVPCSWGFSFGDGLLGAFRANLGWHDAVLPDKRMNENPCSVSKLTFIFIL